MNLSILLDQNVPPALAAFFRRLRPGWEVVHVEDLGFARASDHTIFLWAQEHNAIVFTFDEDFADSRMYPVGSHAGVIRLRVWPTTIEAAEAAAGRLLDLVPDLDLPGSLIIIDDSRIRIRRAARHG